MNYATKEDLKKLEKKICSCGSVRVVTTLPSVADAKSNTIYIVEGDQAYYLNSSNVFTII